MARDVTQPTPTPAPTVAEVARIVEIQDPVIRNLGITQCYSRLAAAFAARSGDGANWCTYATWASRQAGRTIRGEDLFQQLDRRLADSRWLLHPIVTLWRRLLRHGLFRRDTRIGRLTAELHTPFDAVERAGDAVARGNLKVFEEIGLAFAHYLQECPPDGPAEAEQFQRFLDSLRAGDAPDGQRYLRRAFDHYERALRERDGRRRAELTVLANLEIGLHEQARLQPEILEALDAPYVTQEDLGRRALAALVPSAPRWWPVVRRPAAAVVGVAAARVQRASAALARDVITEAFMVLSLPGRMLALGVHLPDAYPETLREPADADLRELLARFEPLPPARDDCGARDWASFDQRMHYIVHLFRSFHLHEDLARAPFTPEQVAKFSSGVVPDGDL